MRMVDVGDKAETAREAVARGRIAVGAAALRAIRAGKVKKGDPLQTARLAGIVAAKRTSDLIPLCHPLPLSHVDVEITREKNGYTIESRVRTTGAHRRRNGSAHRRRGRGADDLRHAEGARQDDGDRRDLRHGEARRAIGGVRAQST